MDVHLNAAHWIYLAGIIVILITMAARKNIVVPAVTATLLTAWAFSGSLVTGLASIFNASLVAAKELFNIFLIIALVTAMLGALREMGADRMMVTPFRGVMRAGTSSFIVLAVVTYVISLFFWPTPAVPLVGAVLIPVAIRAGMTPLSVGMVVAIAGQGMALSSDYIIKVAPGLSAKAAGVDPDVVADKALVLSLIVGLTALIITYVMQRRTFRTAFSRTARGMGERSGPRARRPTPAHRGRHPQITTAAPPVARHRPPRPSPPPPASSPNKPSETPTATATIPGADQVDESDQPQKMWSAKVFALLVPLVYLGLIVYLMLGKFTSLVPPLKGGDAAALVGGLQPFSFSPRRPLPISATSWIPLLNTLSMVWCSRSRRWASCCLSPGSSSSETATSPAAILGLPEDAQAPAFMFDLINAAQSHFAPNAFITTFGVLLVGLIAGLEGSGFTGLPLTGSLAGALGPAASMDPTTLAAVGQMGNIWSGGGTLVAWSSLIAVAGFARVPVLILARKCFLPVMTGLVLCTVFAVLVY